MESDGDDEEIVGELGPIVHPEAHVEKGESEGKIKWGLDGADWGGYWTCSYEDTVEEYDKYLEDEDI